MINSEKMRIKREDVGRLYESDEFALLHMRTHEACVLYGYATGWCFSAPGADNIFDSYNEMGPIFVIIDKKTKGKFTFTFEACDALVDESLEKVNLGDILDLDPGLREFLFHLIYDDVFKEYNKTERMLNSKWIETGYDPMEDLLRPSWTMMDVPELNRSLRGEC